MEKTSYQLIQMYGHDSGRRSSWSVPCVQGFPVKVQMTGIFCAVGKDIYCHVSPGTDISSNFFAFFSFSCFLMYYSRQVNLCTNNIFNYVHVITSGDIKNCSKENIELYFSNRPILMHNISELSYKQSEVLGISDQLLDFFSRAYVKI